MRLNDIPTPCLVIDQQILEQSLSRMQSAVDRVGKMLRPHAKTHKCSRLAALQVAAGAVGICATKLSEAEALTCAGIGGILLTGPMPTARLVARLLDLLERAPDLRVVVDQAENVKLLETALAARGLILEVLLDIDVGLHRTGVLPQDALRLADVIMRSPHLRLGGVQAYAGHLQHIVSRDERRAASRSCLEPAAEVFATLRAKVKTCKIFTGAGTGTAAGDLADTELTEIQPGSYVCMDSEYLAIEQDSMYDGLSFEPALRLLTTVVSANHPGYVTVDAGLKAIYRDGAIPTSLASERGDLVYDWFGDEYGKVSYAAGATAPRMGENLAWTVSHCDPTINLHDRLYLVRNDEIVEEWPIDLRGCSW